LFRFQPAKQAAAYSPGRQPWVACPRLKPTAVGDRPRAAARFTARVPRVPLRSTLGYNLSPASQAGLAQSSPATILLKEP